MRKEEQSGYLMAMIKLIVSMLDRLLLLHPATGLRALQSDVSLYYRFAIPLTPALGFVQVPCPSEEEKRYRLIYVNPQIRERWE